MARSKNGEAISPERRTRQAIKKLQKFLEEARAEEDLGEWRRAKAILSYIEGKKVIALTSELEVCRSTVNTWLRWYETQGVEGLRTRKPTGPPPKMTPEQKEELAGLIDAGPQSIGYQSGVWTGPMVGDLIQKRFGVRYHNHHIPRLLHQLGFSVQRPRKRLARADSEAQSRWLRKELPRIKKRPQPVAES